MKNLFALALLLFALVSCDTESDIDPICGTRLAQLQTYFPLEVGNSWSFDLKGKREVENTHTLNGKSYFEMKNDYNTSHYYRVENAKVYVVRNSLSNKEEMMFDLGAKENKTWNYGPGKVTLMDRNTSVTIGKQKIDNCLQFNFHSKELIDYGFTIWLAPGIGFIQETCQECFGKSYSILQLKSVIIDGKKQTYN